jgi:hypothetical protein
MLPRGTQRNPRIAQISARNLFLRKLQPSICTDVEHQKVLEERNRIKAFFSECLEFMGQTFDRSEAIGLVSSHWLTGERNAPRGYPVQTPLRPWQRMRPLILRTGITHFRLESYRDVPISPSAAGKSFYDVFLRVRRGKYIAIFESWDFGHVH